MATPIVETIAVNLAALIDGITEEAGYNFTLTTIRPKRIHLEGDVNTDRAVIVEAGDVEVVEQADTKLLWRQEFFLQAIIYDSDDATEAIDTRLNKVRSDIEKKLMTADNYKLGGYADGLMIKGAEKFIAEPRISGISVNVDVLYAVDIDDPYSNS